MVVVVVVLMFVAVVVVVGAIDDVAVVVVAAAVVVVVFIAWIASSRGNRGEMVTQLESVADVGLVAEHRLGRCRRHRDAADAADVTFVAAVFVSGTTSFSNRSTTVPCRYLGKRRGQPPSLAATSWGQPPPPSRASLRRGRAAQTFARPAFAKLAGLACIPAHVAPTAVGDDAPAFAAAP